MQRADGVEAAPPSVEASVPSSTPASPRTASRVPRQSARRPPPHFLARQKMRRWSHAVRGVVRTFLTSERRLCDEVFESDEELGHEWFADVARGCVLQLLGFADAVAVSARAIEMLYRTLGTYEALTDVQPELEAVFSGDDARGFFAGEVSSTVEQLASTVRHTIEEFGHAIHGEASRRPVHRGEIHPMTRYVLNYGGLLADCRGTLDAVLGDAGLDDGTEASTDARQLEPRASWEPAAEPRASDHGDTRQKSNAVLHREARAEFRFGLYGVDFDAEDRTRYARHSARWYAGFLRGGELRPAAVLTGSGAYSE
ncbi:hypothetical protein BAE44_0021464 [Dichanthelium oligosanthes]|uniref:Exocyst subunit Exo70 family protein n=1 Tax=Dichanthelium oligosanthes TaxID=888268 RepID=A0A1E5UXF1_9POAL|nr:hypothetical protein BAE44_0021464 [Dichanthelium oligosanthes]